MFISIQLSEMDVTGGVKNYLFILFHLFINLTLIQKNFRKDK